MEIGGLELSPLHNGLPQRIEGARSQALLPSVGAALRAIALSLSQLADAFDPTPPPRDPSRSGHHPVRVPRGS